MGILYFQNKESKTFIKYNRGEGKFLLINDKKEFLDFRQTTEEDLNKYIGENNFEPLDEKYFNLYFGLISTNKK